MTLLSDRVKKAKNLRITKTNDSYNTWGSQGDTYRIKLNSTRKDIVTPDGWLNIPVFHTSCKKVIYNYNKTDCELAACKGNNQHTVCYHCLGAIWQTFNKVGRQVSFFQSYHDAISGLQFGGFIAKTVNNNNTGSVWCVVRKVGEAKQEMKFETMKEFE